MLAYRVFTGCFLFVAVSLAAGACSSSDDSGSTEDLTPFSPSGNGQPVSEKAACDALKNARQARLTALNCGPVTMQPCPTYIQIGHDACSQYDQGTIDGCVAFIQSLPSCKQALNRECIVIALPGTAPAGCETVDAGADAGEDAASVEDAGTDATNDAPAGD